MKKLRILIIIAMLLLILFSNVPAYAFSVTDLGGTTSGQETKINEVGQNVIKIISTIGSICSVVVLIIMGIKYMLGSTEEKAEYKKSLLPYVIGATIVFSASIIASVIYNIAIKL